MKRFGKFRSSKTCVAYALYDPYVGTDCFYWLKKQMKFNRISPVFDSIKRSNFNGNIAEWIDVYSTPLRKAKVNRLDGRSYCEIN